MKNKQISNPFPPLHIRASDYPISVFRVESAPRLKVNSELEERNLELRLLHTHFTYEVFFVVSGKLKLITEHGRTEYENSIIIIPPKLNHVSIRDGESYSLLFSLDGDLTLSHKLENEVHSLPLSDEITFYVRQLNKESLLRTKEAEHAVHHLASLIFSEILNSVKPISDKSSSQNPHQKHHINAIDEYINHNFAKQITLADIAAHVHLSKRQITRTIRKEYNCTFPELLSDKRLGNAVSLLNNTDLSIAQIISETFCNSPNYFYRVFRKKYGISPLQYRKQMRARYPKEK